MWMARFCGRATSPAERAFGGPGVEENRAEIEVSASPERAVWKD